MVALSPTALEAFLADQDDTPVVMLNLIRFQPDGGRARYLDYLGMAKPILARFGAKILFGGDGLAVLLSLVYRWLPGGKALAAPLPFRRFGSASWILWVRVAFLYRAVPRPSLRRFSALRVGCRQSDQRRHTR